MALLCALALALQPLPPSLAQQGAAGASAPTYPVRGTVLNSVTGQPVARALVQVSAQGVLTDGDGRFSFEGVPGGSTDIVVHKPGYLDRRNRFRAAHSVNITAGLGDLTFTLTPAAAILGQVSLTNGEAADGIHVFLLRRSIQDGRANWVRAGSASTHSDGSFHLMNLEPGTYIVGTQAAADPDSASPDAPQSGYPANYYPGTADFAAAGKIVLNAGQTFQVDLPIAREPFYLVTATVTNSQPGEGLSVRLRDLNGRPLPLPVDYDSRTQKIRAYLPAGNYVLEATGFGPAVTVARTEISVGSTNLRGVRMTLLPAATITGNVRRELSHESNLASSPRPDPRLMPITITLSPAEGTSGGQFGRLTTQTNESDGFALRNVAPGRYWVDASAPEGYIASIAAGGTNLVREPLSVSVGGGAAPIEIAVRDDSAMLSVQVNGLAEGTQAYLYAVPFADAPGRMRWMILESGKAENLSGLAPGSYRLFAFDAPQDLEYRDPEAMQSLGDRGKTVSLEPNGQTSVQLDVISTQ